MFIVRADDIPKIKNGTITQLRRKRDKARVKKESVHQVKMSLFGEPECLVKVTEEPRQEQLSAISDEDAKASGSASAEAFIARMLELYGANGLETGDGVWVYTIKHHDHKRSLGEMRAKWRQSQEDRVKID